VNNKSNFEQLFTNGSDISVMNVGCYSSLTQYLNRVFGISTSCSNTRSKSVEKWHNCLNINKLLWYIITHCTVASAEC